MKIAYSGHRYLHDKDLDSINGRLMQDVLEPGIDEMFFGGAIGADSHALRYAYLARGSLGKLPKLVVVCPDTKEALPRMAYAWAEKYADRYVELHHPIQAADKWNAFILRDQWMVDQVRDCGQLVAFWSGRQHGGTWRTVEYAIASGALWEHVPIIGQEMPR